MTKISVVIPTFNRCATLSRAIESVLNQTLFEQIELIVIDDGSTDETEQLMKKFPKVHYHQQAQHGVSHARNTGIRLAKGEWIAFLDSDDAFTPDKIEQQYLALQAEPDYLLCHTDEIWYRHGKRVNPMKKHKKYGGWIFQHCLPRCAISPSSVMMHRTLIESVGYFDEQLPACEDYDLWLRITARYPVLYLDKPLTVKYGGHEDQLSKKYWGMDRFRIIALDKFLTSKIACPHDENAAREMLREKIHIMLTGARKRNNQAAIAHYEAILHRHALSQPALCPAL